MPNIQTAPVSMEMGIIITIIFILFGLMVGGLGYFIRCQFERILSKLDMLDEQRATCRETLTERFADRAETRESVQRLHERADNHDHRITVLEQKII